MKKFGLMLCVLLCCGGASRAQGESPDIPPDDPAYANADILTKAKIFDYAMGYPPSGTYSVGERSATRYEFAVAIARILQNAQLELEMRAPKNPSSSRATLYPLLQPPLEKNRELTDAITKLAIEFAPELKALAIGDALEKFQSTLRAATQPQFKIAAPFSDVPKNHWAFEAVEKLRQSGIVIGYPNAMFSAKK